MILSLYLKTRPGLKVYVVLPLSRSGLTSVGARVGKFPMVKRQTFWRQRTELLRLRRWESQNLTSASTRFIATLTVVFIHLNFRFLIFTLFLQSDDWNWIFILSTALCKTENSQWQSTYYKSMLHGERCHMVMCVISVNISMSMAPTRLSNQISFQFLLCWI